MVRQSATLRELTIQKGDNGPKIGTK